MFKARSLESLIHDKIPLGKRSNTGYETVKCASCHDYKPRGGFKFEGDTIYYACFNCGLKPIYIENSGEISGKFRQVLRDFGIESSEIDEIVNVSFFKKPDEEPDVITLESILKPKVVHIDAKLPKGSIRLGSTQENKTIQENIQNYLKDRCIDPNGYPFYYSLEPKLINRVIIPFYRNRKLIYWQARSIVDENPRYRNCEVPKTSILFNADQLTSWDSSIPLFVVEGVFDALPLNGVATLGSALNDEKLELLNRTSRKLIFVIDKDITGKHVAEIALSKNWNITFAPGDGDVNKAIRNYGKIWTVYELMNRIPKTKIDAEMQIKLNCSYDPRKDKKYKK